MSVSRSIQAILILGISPALSFAQSEPRSNRTASAWGQVVFAEGDRPIRHARVELVSSSTDSAESRLTDDKGQFDFEGLEPITYEVIVSAPGYQKLEATAQVQGKTGPLLLRLRRTEEVATPMTNDVVSVQELLKVLCRGHRDGQTKAVVWAYNVKKGGSSNFQSSAEACAKHLKNWLQHTGK
jgi:hypothetical protein